MAKSIEALVANLKIFKESVFKELSSLGLRITALEKEASDALAKFTELQRQMDSLKLNLAKIELSTTGSCKLVVESIHWNHHILTRAQGQHEAQIEDVSFQ